MKLSDYAKKMGISYRTAWNWFKAGKLDAVQMPSGTIIVKNEKNKDILKEMEKDHAEKKQEKKQ